MYPTKKLVKSAISSCCQIRSIFDRNLDGFIKIITFLKLVVIAGFFIVLVSIGLQIDCFGLKNFFYSSINKVRIRQQTIPDEIIVKPGKEQKNVIGRYVLTADIESDFDAFSKICEIATGDISSQFDGIVIIGDLTSFGTNDDLKAMRNEIDKCDISTYSIPGDRDLYAAKGLNFYHKFFPEDFFYLKDSGLLFINNADEYKGIPDDQFKFISDHISDTNFIFLHNPIYFGGTSLVDKIMKKGMGQYDEEVEKQRVKLIEMIRNANVKAVFAGDRHLYSHDIDKDKSTLSYYVIGSLNAGRSIGGATYAIFTIYDDGSYAVENIGLTN